VRTPSGVECEFYFADYYRGREWEECRLLARSPDRAQWTPKLCATCPVPAYCTLSGQPVAEPMVGCGRCHEHRAGAKELGLSLSKGLGLAQSPDR